MDDNEAIHATVSDNRPCIATSSPQFIPYEPDADTPVEHKKRRVEVGSSSRTTSAERNQKSRRLKAELIREARRLEELKQPFPSDVQRAVLSYERDKARNRIYLRKKRASEKGNVNTSIRETPGGSDTPTVVGLPAQHPTEGSTNSPVPSRADEAAYCTGLNLVNDHNHQRRFAEKAVGNDSESTCIKNAPIIWNSERRVSMEATHQDQVVIHFTVQGSQDPVKEKCRRRWSI